MNKELNEVQCMSLTPGPTFTKLHKSHLFCFILEKHIGYIPSSIRGLHLFEKF